MAAILSPYSTVGFYKSPVTKGLLGGMFASSCALHVPQLAYLKKYLVCTFSDVFDSGKVWRLLTCRTVFLDVKDLICGALLLYYFRVFERRFGSRKFSVNAYHFLRCGFQNSFILCSTTLSFLLEFLVIVMFRLLEVDLYTGPSNYLTSGPFCLVFPLFVGYFCDIPRVAHTHILGVPITGKSLTYLLGLQMASSSASSAVAGICGLIAGLLYRYNFLLVQKWFQVPEVVASLFDSTVGWLISSSPPQEGLLQMGATLEIQRSQQLEVLEQQMLFNRAREARMYGQVYQNTAFHNRFQPDLAANLRHRENGTNFVDDSDDSTASGNNQDHRENGEPGTSFRESQVQTLVEMGFERQKVVEALRNTNNDLNLATTLLLQDS